jgi:phosphoribosylglycinamide formyltransferase 1
VKKLAIFASGTGSNARAIMEYFKGHRSVSVQLIVCNRPEAGVLKHAADFQVPVLQVVRQDFVETENLLQKLKEHQIDWIILAGFLWLIPADLIEMYRNKIINIHPALLPDFGGKGMYGSNVHKAVLSAGSKSSGITIHYVNEEYDKGDIIAQFSCPVDISDTPETLVGKIHKLEQRYYPETIEKLVLKSK